MPPARSKRPAADTAPPAPAAKRVRMGEAELVYSRKAAAVRLKELEAGLVALEKRVVRARLVASKGDVLLHNAIVANTWQGKVADADVPGLNQVASDRLALRSISHLVGISIVHLPGDLPRTVKVVHRGSIVPRLCRDYLSINLRDVTDRHGIVRALGRASPFVVDPHTFSRTAWAVANRVIVDPEDMVKTAVRLVHALTTVKAIAPTGPQILCLRMAMAKLPDELADLIADMADVYDHPRLVGASAFYTTIGSSLVGTHPILFRNAKHVSIAGDDEVTEDRPRSGFTTAGVYIGNGPGNRCRVVNGCFVDVGHKANRTDIAEFFNPDRDSTRYNNDPMFEVHIGLGRGVLPAPDPYGR